MVEHLETRASFRLCSTTRPLHWRDGEGGLVTAEGEHGEGDADFGRTEPEAESGEQVALRVSGLVEALGQPVFQRGVDGRAVADDAPL